MKPEVKYHSTWAPIKVGLSAYVYLASPHHTLGDVDCTYVITSIVKEVKDNGDFETLNTQYVKVP